MASTQWNPLVRTWEFLRRPQMQPTNQQMYACIQLKDVGIDEGQTGTTWTLGKTTELRRG
eukprot:5119557-Amphidinium_carterae.1